MSEAEATASNSKRKVSTPPDGYVCDLCGISGHWIQQCSKKKRKKKKTHHVAVPGVDPSAADIERARELQKIKPPKCFCGETSRLKKVKKSKAGGEQSRANGVYFFFCAKKRDDVTKCRFARPVQDEITPKNQRLCTFFAKNGKCKKGDNCVFSHDRSLRTPTVHHKKDAEIQSSSGHRGNKKEADIDDGSITKKEVASNRSGSSSSNSSSYSGSTSSSSSVGSEDDDQQF